jgi:hypothetical protein
MIVFKIRFFFSIEYDFLFFHSFLNKNVAIITEI